MNKQKAVVMGFSFLLLATTIPAFAASIRLNNGGLGQVANNPASFGVAICNGGSAPISQSVPVAIAVNGATVMIPSPSAIAAGSCGYAYVDYSQLNMAAGQSYTVTVTIDPNHTIATNTDNQASYSIMVPGVAASTTVTAQATHQHSNFVATIGSLFANFFTAVKNLF